LKQPLFSHGIARKDHGKTVEIPARRTARNRVSQHPLNERWINWIGLVLSYGAVAIEEMRKLGHG
jgi:hypothetical protein